MQEIWKPLDKIIDVGIGYEISSLGNVRSVDRIIETKNGNRFIKGIIMKQLTDKFGYSNITFSNISKKRKCLVHRLVALAFIKNPENKPEVNHKDCNKSNNNVDNLEWSTSKENILHSWSNSLANDNIGEKNNNSKLKKDDVLEIREMYNCGEYTQTKLSKLFNVRQDTISDIVNRRTWKHI